MWQRMMCCTNCARLHPVQCEGLLSPLVYCCRAQFFSKICSEECSASRNWIGARNSAIVVFTKFIYVVHAPCCDSLWGNVTRLCSPFGSVITRTVSKNADPLAVWRDSAALWGGIASHRNIWVFSLIKDESSSAQRYEVQNFIFKVIASVFL